MSARFRIGIDLGGTKIEGAAVDAAGLVRARRRVPIVLGGGLSAIAALYEEVPRMWGRYVFSDRVVTRLLPPVHGDSSGVRGAAWLWPRGEAP